MTFAEAGEQFEYIIGCSFFSVKAARFFLCTVEHESIIKSIFFHKYKIYEKIKKYLVY